MSIKNNIWNCVYGKSRFIRNRHLDNLILGGYEGISGRMREVASLNMLNKMASQKVKFPEYKMLYNVEEFKQKILANDVISFDIFDTLILRPFCRPTDLFFLLESKNGIPNFRELRIKAEQYARETTKKQNGEINIYDIYDVLHEWCDIVPEIGIKEEVELETELCFAQPFVYELYRYAVDNDKEIIITSDMYIPSDVLGSFLTQKGYENLSKIYVSCDFEASKYSGKLPQIVRKDYGDKKILHIGDNKRSDYDMWKKCANDRILLFNVNKAGLRNRLQSGLTIQGSVYAGIVNAHIYNGMNGECKSPYFEYGYVYGGILTLGFCQWLHNIVQKEKIDKILFLARDCKIIKEIYDEEYSDDNNTYFLTSRIALLPILAELFFDTFVDEAFKLRLFEENMTIQEAFKDLDLESVLEHIPADDNYKNSRIKQKDWDDFKRKVYFVKSNIQKSYDGKYKLLKSYISQQIDVAKRIIIVDLGWRGSSILYLKYMIEKEFPETTVIGAMFGTADYSIAKMRTCDATIYSYLFSPNDSSYSEIGGKAMINADERLFLEYMYTDVINSVIGYAYAEDGRVYDIRENKSIDDNNAMVVAMHDGIRKFVKDYSERLGSVKDIIVLNKEDAYMPMYRLLHNKKLKILFKNYKEKKSTMHGFLEE